MRSKNVILKNTVKNEMLSIWLTTFSLNEQTLRFLTKVLVPKNKMYLFFYRYCTRTEVELN